MQKRMQKAFTLLELIVVVIVLGILALVAVPAFSGVINNTNESVVESTAKSVARAADALSVFNDGAQVNLTSSTNIADAITDTTLNTADGWAKDATAGSISLNKNGNTETFYVCDGGARAVVQTAACS